MHYDELIIIFERRGQNEQGDERYQANIRHNKLSITGGPFYRKQDYSRAIWAAEIQAVQREYADLIEVAHQMSETTQAPYIDQEDLLKLGRDVRDILPERIQMELTQATTRARHRGHGLRITLQVHANARALLGVPWELLVLPLNLEERDGDSDDFLLIEPRFILVRQMLGVGQTSLSAFDRPLRFQSFVAQPDGVDLIKSEQIKQSLAPYTGDISACWYEGPSTLKHMQRRLQHHAPQIVHLLCHGSENTTQIVARHDLLLTHDNGTIRRASVFELAPVMMQVAGLRLVVLQACHGGANTIDAQRNASESVALGLLRHGVPFVIAFQGEVAQKPAAAFMNELFRALSQGSSVDQAVGRGRAAMIVAEGMADWSLPVLYSGQAPAEPRTVLHRLADGLDVAMRNPKLLHTLRSLIIALALCLVVSALAQWLMFPNMPRPQLTAQFPAIVVFWICTGLICPALIAAFHRSTYRSARLPENMPLRALHLAKWSGAYLGYGLGWVTGLLVVGVLYGLGVFFVVPAYFQSIIAIILVLWALLWSYTATRGQVQSVLALYEDAPKLFKLQMAALLISAGVFLIFGAPYVLAYLTSAWFPSLWHPAPLALLVALALLGFVVAGDTSS